MEFWPAAVTLPLTRNACPSASSTQATTGMGRPCGNTSGAMIRSMPPLNSAAADGMGGYGVQGGMPSSVLPRSGERTMNCTSRLATAMVLVADPEAAPAAPGEALRASYGLTAAETRVAEALLEHERLAEVAASLGVSLSTVRTLLQRAFDKTGTHRQAELVRLMLAHQTPPPAAAMPAAPASSARTSPPP